MFTGSALSCVVDVQLPYSPETLTRPAQWPEIYAALNKLVRVEVNAAGILELYGEWDL